MNAEKDPDKTKAARVKTENNKNGAASDNPSTDMRSDKKSSWTDDMYDAMLPKISCPSAAATQEALTKEFNTIEEIHIVESDLPYWVELGNRENGTTTGLGLWQAKACLVLTRLHPSGEPAETAAYTLSGEKIFRKRDEWLSCTTIGKKRIWRAQPRTGERARELGVRIGSKMDRMLGCVYDRYQHQEVIRHGDFMDSCGWDESKYFTRDKGKYKTERCIMRNNLSTISRELGIVVRTEPGGFRFSQPMN